MAIKDLTQGSEARQIFYFTVPMLIGNVFQQFYHLTDSIVVGRFLGKQALGAVGTSFPIIFLLVALVMGLTMGSSILISQYYGAKDFKSVKKAIDTGYIVVFVASIFITVVGLIFSESILRLINAPEEIIPQAKTFLNITFIGILFLFGYNSVSAVLRGLGDSKTPLYFLIVATLLNIILVLLFVAVFKWGIAGSAYATLIAQSVAFFIGIFYVNKKYPFLKFSFKKISFDKQILLSTIKIGLPSGVQQMMIAGSVIVLAGLTNGFGTSAIAAFAVAGRLDSFAIMPAMNLSIGLSTFVGQNIGANKIERVKKGYIATLKIGTVISLVTTIVFILFGDLLIGMFNKDVDVIHIGHSYLYIVGAFYVVFSTMFITQGVIRGAGETLMPMLITICSLWIVRVPLAFYLSKHFGIIGVWWAIPIAWCVGLVLSQMYYFSGKWKNKKLVKKVELPVAVLDESAWDSADLQK